MLQASIGRKAGLGATVAFLASLTLAQWSPASAEMAASSDDSSWTSLKTELFANRPIKDGTAFLKIEAPTRVQDAAMVPVDIDALGPQSPERFVKTITLIVDHNPTPVAAVFHLTPESGLASVSTRIRINQYSDVRAIAETNTGELFMVSRYVKATGGCSAPALKNEEAALAQIGKLLLRQQAGGNGLTEAKLNIRHPNYSGMQMHAIGNYFIPEHSVSRIEARVGDRLVFAADGSIALSEDPMLRFLFRPRSGEQIAVTVQDTKGSTFSKTWPVEQAEVKARNDGGAPSQDM